MIKKIWNMEKGEKKTAIDRIVRNVSQNPEMVREAVRMQNEKVFEKQEFPKLEGIERRKTTSELQIVGIVNDITNGLRRNYGLADFEIPEKNVHIVSESGWPKLRESQTADNAAAFANIDEGACYVPETKSQIMFAVSLLHEVLHLKSYNALQMVVRKGTTAEPTELVTAPYRSGIQVHPLDYTRRRMNAMNEAISEELVKRMSDVMLKNPIFSEEMESIRKIRSLPDLRDEAGKPFVFDRNTYHVSIKTEKITDQGQRGTLSEHKFSNISERRALLMLADKIFVRNRKKFGAREKVFQMFVQAFMTGNILPLRIIDRTFKKGTLKQIATFETGADDFEQFVKKL